MTHPNSPSWPQAPQQPGHPAPGQYPAQPQPGAYGAAQPGAHPQQPGHYPPPQPGQHAPQPGHYGAPQPGHYGAPQPGQHAPPPGAYGAPQPGVHPQQPYGAPQPGQYPGAQAYGAPHPGAYPPPGQPGSPWGQGVRPAAPQRPASSGRGKIIGGAFLALICGIALFQNAHEAFDDGAGLFATIIFSLFLGGSLLLTLTGVFTAAGKPSPKAVVLGVPLAATLIGVGAGPFASTAYCEADEATRYAELTAAMDQGGLFLSSRWTTEYELQVDEKFRRKEWRAQWMLARTRENIEYKDAAGLRQILVEIAESGDPELYAEAEASASKAFGQYYDEAKARMYAPLAEGASREFPVDENLREAFGIVLEKLTHAPEAKVYVAFTNGVNLDPPEGTDELLALYRDDPKAKSAFPKGAPVIEAKESFSPAYDSRRRRTFMTAMSESFGQVFDSNLLTLVPLAEGESREGKIVIEVSSQIVRLPTFFFWERELAEAPGTTRVAGLLFGIAVDWKFEVYGTDGNKLYAQPLVRTEPAGNVSVSTQPGDPDWGMYSVLMDSAYYNYSRQVTGMFGLTPPPERTVFAYSGV